MYKYLKLIFAIGIFGCLFLPLSQCSYPQFSKVKLPVNEIQKSSPKNTVVEWNSVVLKLNKIPESPIEWCVSLAFIFPLLFCFIVPKTYKLKLATIVLQTGITIWLFFVVYTLVISLEPLYGGYLFTIFTTFYFIITIYEWYLIFGRKISSA